MKTFCVIAYATRNDYYEELSQNLAKSCQSYNIPLHLKLIDSLGSWEKNTHHKAEFILECLDTLEYDNLVYVDVDAIFLSYPDLFDSLDCDVSFRIENFRWRSNEPLSGTVFLRRSEEVKSFVRDWIKTNEQIRAERRNPFTWEQYNMKRALDLHPGLQFHNLPPEYVCITDHTRRLYPGIIPIVEHFQASRKTAR